MLQSISALTNEILLDGDFQNIEAEYGYLFKLASESFPPPGVTM